MRNLVLRALLAFSIVVGCAAASADMKDAKPAVVQVTPAATVPGVMPVQGVATGTVKSPTVRTLNGKPLIFGDHRPPVEEKKKDPAAPAQQPPIDPSQLLQMMTGMGGGNTGLSGGSKPTTSMSNYLSSGTMSSCSANGSVPPSVMAAYHEAQEFRDRCAPAQRGANQKIAISDFSNMVPTMWIFDSNGNCLKKTAITYGNGNGRGQPQACSDDGEHLTPPGFHLTCMHSGPKYATATSPGYVQNDALGECSLEGQGSVGRGVVIHRAQAPGTASSFGCSGVCEACFDEVKATLGLGALVYNYFGNSFDPSCRNKGGQSHSTRCSFEGENPPAEESPVPGTGQTQLQDGTTTK
jgi:hypothetical protein